MSDALANDLGKHLAAELQVTTNRHRKLAKGGGVSALVWSAAEMHAAQKILLEAVAGYVVFVERDKRQELFDITLLKLLTDLSAQRGAVLAAAQLTDAVFGVPDGSL